MTISSIDRHRRASRSRAQQPQDGSAAAAADSETSAADETGNRALHDDGGGVEST